MPRAISTRPSRTQATRNTIRTILTKPGWSAAKCRRCAASSAPCRPTRPFVEELIRATQHGHSHLRLKTRCHVDFDDRHARRVAGVSQTDCSRCRAAMPTRLLRRSAATTTDGRQQAAQGREEDLQARTGHRTGARHRSAICRRSQWNERRSSATDGIGGVPIKPPDGRR